MLKYKGIPIMILEGKVRANAIETYKLGLAAATAIWEALTVGSCYCSSIITMQFLD
jgi:hypothetical protein